MPSLKTQIQWITRGQRLLIGLMLLALGLFYWAVYAPQSRRIDHISSRIGESERELVSSQTQTRVLPKVQADIDRLRERLADYNTLPTKPGDLGQFQLEIAELARRDHLRQPSISWPGTPKRAEGAEAGSQQLYELPVSVKFDGNFSDNVFVFLRHLESLPRLIRIKSLSIKGVGITGDVHVELLMNLYYTEG
jgi:Tfp pilus assembly protein PilO